MSQVNQPDVSDGQSSAGNSAASASASVRKTAETSEWLTLAPWIVVAALWLPFFWRLTSVWSSSVDYSYGWAVPLLAWYLLSERLKFAPVVSVAAQAMRGGQARDPRGRASRALSWLAMGGGFLVAAAITPILEANRLWPSAQWIAAAGVLSATFGVLARAGGWRWSAHFFFPVAFATTALIWPAAVQVPLMHALANWNAWLTAEAVSLLGHPAVLHGNIIEVGTGFVGVDEACSGLRSLQGVWMLGWFFGELMRFSWRRRVWLVVLALGIAFAGNFARTVFLTLKIAAGGATAGDRWHDLAGNAVLVVTLLLVAGTAYWLSRKATQPAGTGKPVHFNGARFFPLKLAATLVAIIATTEAATRAWYGWRTLKADRVEWQLATMANGWSPLAVPERSVEILRCSSAEGRAWNEPLANRQALAFVFRWEGDSVVGEEAIYHDPSQCLPLIGTELEERLAPTEVGIGGRRLTFQTYRFSAQGKPQHVFFCLWDAFRGEPLQSSSAGGQFVRYRLQRVKEGRPRADLAHVTFVLQGEASDERAVAWLHETVANVLVEK